jgi:hypothetical protein
MAIFHNMDRIDAAINTKHPFRWTCPLEIGGEFPVREMISVRLHVTENSMPPLRISRFIVDDDVMQWYIQDNAGRNRLVVNLPVSASATGLYAVRDLAGCLAGHIVCTAACIKAVHALIQKAGGDIGTNVNDFIFDDDCHVPMLSGVFKAVTVNGITHTSDVVIHTGDNVLISCNTTQGSKTFSMSAVSDYKEQTSANTDFTALQINTDPVIILDTEGGWHLTMTHALASNLRIHTDSDGINFRGVQDV